MGLKKMWVIERGFLPPCTTLLGDTLKVLVALCRRGFSRCTQHCRDAWRHDHRSIWMTVSNIGINAVLVVSAVSRERGQRTRDLIKQRTNLSCIINLFAGQR